MDKPHVTLIAACDRNRAIGKGNTLPWRHRGDMSIFKQATTGNTVVMGSKTFESMKCRPLPDRLNIVITRDPSKYEHIEGVFFVTSVEEALSHHIDGHLFVIGGAEIYKQFIPFADLILLHKLDLEVEGADTFFPEFNESEKIWSHTIYVHKAGEAHADDVAFEQHAFVRILNPESTAHF